MKKKSLMMGIILLLCTAWLSGCPSQGISVHKTSTEPSRYMNMTEQQMEQFPHLKETILTNSSGGEIPREEWSDLRDLLLSYETEFIQYHNEYYVIRFTVAD